MQFTKEAIAGLQTEKPDQIFWDDTLPGFGVRLRGGKKRWIIQYRFETQQRRESLGDVRRVELEAARAIARKRFAQVELGTDPAAERAKARDAAAAAKHTLANVSARYLAAKEDRLRPNTYKQAKYHFEVLWKPLRDRPIAALRRADVAARLQEITKEHGRTAAARARGNLSALYGWAMREGLCESNPVLVTNDPAEGIKPRERVLADRELAAVWRACSDDDFGRIVKLLILTGCRREEIGGLKWSEIDFDAGVMTIPGERTKNHRTHALPLPPLAINILKSAPHREGRSYVFANRGGGFSAWSYSTMRLNTHIAELEGKPLSHWTLHDLRRTMRTGLGKLGVPPHIAELVINHVKGGVEAIYDRHKYEREIAQALNLWASHVVALIDGRESSNVTALRIA